MVNSVGGNMTEGENYQDYPPIPEGEDGEAFF